MCATDLVKRFLRALCYLWLASVKINKKFKAVFFITYIMCSNLVKPFEPFESKMFSAAVPEKGVG